MNNEYDGDPATGFTFGLYRYIGDNGHVNVCKPIYDEENKVSYIEWDKYELNKLLERANTLRWPTATEMSEAVHKVYGLEEQQDIFKAKKLLSILSEIAQKDNDNTIVSSLNNKD